MQLMQSYLFEPTRSCESTSIDKIYHLLKTRSENTQNLSLFLLLRKSAICFAPWQAATLHLKSFSYIYGYGEAWDDIVLQRIVV